MYDEFYSKAHELLSQGLAFATAIVVRAEKPTSGRPGDKAIVTPDGVMHGWIGGSCAQPTVIDEAMKALADGKPRLIRLSADPETQTPRDGLIEMPMTCFSGGTLEIYVEPQRPQARLMIVGSLPVAQAMVRLGRAMNYHVIAVDPDTGGASMPDADEVITELTGLASKTTPLTYVVVASHGHYDEIALEQVLPSDAAYVALVASRLRAEAVLEYLAARGISETALNRLKYPAGLDIKALHGDEIALSIMAEIVQKRRSAEVVDVSSLIGEPDLPMEPAEAIDPVCGMTVEIESAQHTYEHEGQTYYFCCAGCRVAFAENPEKYLAQPVPAGEAIDPVCGMTVDIASAKYMTEYEGKFIYFCAAGCQTAFEENPLKYAESLPS